MDRRIWTRDVGRYVKHIERIAIVENVHFAGKSMNAWEAVWLYGVQHILQMIWANKINGRLSNVLQVPLKRSTVVNRFARGRAACTATNVEIRELYLADHREDVGVCKYRLAGQCAK